MNDNKTNEAIESILRFLDDDLFKDQIESDNDDWNRGYIKGVESSISTINILKRRWKDKGLL
tara:strand:+ start:445 stop:630 length:186 start_codon:yes stop_codon:yes gene_type:complete